MARNEQVTSEWQPSTELRRDVDASEVEQAIAELTVAARGGRTYSQPIERIKAFSRQKPAFHHPFQHEGGTAEFLKAVRECAIAGGSWQTNKMMKAYVERSNDYLRTKALPSGMNETVGTDGGFLVTPEFSNQILMRTYDNDILERTTMMPLGSGNTLKIPAVHETSRANGSRFGGVYGYWRGEAEAATASKPALSQISLTVDAITVLVRMTDELIADTTGISAEAFVNLVVPQELKFRIGDAIINGDGVNKPFGIMDSSSLSRISVSKESGQAAATIVSDNILKMWARLHVSCKKNAIWLVDPSVGAALPKMTVGTAGSQMVTYMPPGGLSAAPYATLMGRPVIETEFCQDLGTVGDIILWDPTTYLTAMKQGVQAATSMHVYFLTSEQAYRFTQRIDGKSWWTSALTPRNGSSNTLTNIVVLATRA